VIGLRDVGFRGFAIESAEPVTPKTRATFLFTATDGPLVQAEAVAVHCHLSADGGGVWVSGWEFPEQPHLEAAIDRLVDSLLDDLSLS
jgi:hypothetical protein